jgi:hypothetical protein
MQQRKPPPLSAQDDDGSIQADFSELHNRISNVSQQYPVAQRYSLTDNGPIENEVASHSNSRDMPSRGNRDLQAIGFSELDNAITKLQIRLSPRSYLTNPPLETRTVDPQPNIAHAFEPQHHRNSHSSSQETAVEFGYQTFGGLDKYGEPAKFVGEGTYLNDQRGSMEVPYRLPTINSGTPLDWEGVPHSSVDPFLDPNVPLNRLPDFQYPSYPPEPLYFSEDRPEESHVLQPQPAYPDSLSHDPEKYAGLEGDSFQAYSRAAYSTPQSRSPTPPSADGSYDIRDDFPMHDSVFGGDFHYEQQPLHDQAAQSRAHNAPMGSSSTQHFGPAPPRQKRRLGNKRVFPLTQGNFVVDLDIPRKLVLPQRGDEEMMTTRYASYPINQV